MKTADSIAAMTEAKADDKSAQNSGQEAGTGRFTVGNQWRIKPGEVKNPGGRPKRDYAAELARRIIQGNGNPEIIEEYCEGFARQLKKGNGYTFKELAERGYGKQPEFKHITHAYAEEADGDLNQQIADLERKLGLAGAIDDASRIGLEAAGTGPANGHAKDTAVLP